MDLLWICVVIIALYARTITYNYNIDDNVPRSGYLNTIPQQLPTVEFFDSKPPKIARVFNILIHCLNTCLVHALFGGKVALLFAVHPISVNGTAWMTGNYYAVTAFFTLVAMFFIGTSQSWIGIVLGSVFFWAAMRSTITSIGLPLFYMLVGSIAAWPLGLIGIEYVTSKRFKNGMKLRNSDRDKFTWSKLVVATKVVAYYLKMTIFPDKLAFFHKLGYDYDRNPRRKEAVDKVDAQFWISLVGLSVFTYVGFLIDIKATLFFLCLIAAFGQYKVLGQFVAERYLYLPMLGVLSLIVMVAPDPVYWAFVGFCIYKTHTYIPTFKNIEALYKNSAETFDDCPTGHTALASYYFGKDLSKVFPCLNAAMNAEKNSFETHLNFSSYYIIANNKKLAFAHLRTAQDLYKDIDQPSLGEVLERQEEQVNKM